MVPASGYVPLSSPHPAESLFSQSLLSCYEEGSSTKQAPWRSGAHALYLLWLSNPNLRLKQQYQEQQAVYLQQRAQFDRDQAAAADKHLQQPSQPSPRPPQQQPLRQKKGGGLFACFGCGGAEADEQDSLYTQQQHQAQQQQQIHQRPAGPVAPQVSHHAASAQLLSAFIRVFFQPRATHVSNAVPVVLSGAHARRFMPCIA